MASAAAAASVSNAESRRRRIADAPSGFNVQLLKEKKRLEQKLTTCFPAQEDILFDKDLSLLMMDGYNEATHLQKYFKTNSVFAGHGTLDGSYTLVKFLCLRIQLSNPTWIHQMSQMRQPCLMRSVHIFQLLIVDHH
jgi:hypothetical protein